MTERGSLLFPAIKAVRFRLATPGKRGVIVGMALFGAVVQLLLFAATIKTLRYFLGFKEIGLILGLRFFQAAWLMLFAMLVFSSLITAISTIYLARDNEILVAAPVPVTALFRARFIQVLCRSGWMVAAFSLPVFAAYGVVLDGPFSYWPAMLAAIAGTTATAAAVGCLVAVLLVRFFPARRTKDIAVYLSLLFGIALYLVLRLIRPEQLVNPESFGHFLDYLSALSSPFSFWLPASWPADLLSALLLDHQVDFLLLFLVVITPAALLVVGEWSMDRFFFTGLTRAAESYEGIVRRQPTPYGAPRPFIRLLDKEKKMFLRDSAEWSQLFMIAALVVVYLYNFSVLPLDRVPFAEKYLAALIAFLNIGMVAFLAASLSLRFVFPSISAEAGGFVQLQASPLPLKTLLAAKLLFFLIPFTLFSLLLLAASNHFLGVQGPMWWVSLGVGTLLTWTAVWLALGFGALYADFNLESRAAALGGAGAFLYLLVMGGVTLVVLASGGWPVYQWTRKWQEGIPLSLADILALGGWAMGCAAVLGCACRWILAHGIKRLSL